MPSRIKRGLPGQALSTGMVGEINEYADIATVLQAGARVQGCRRRPLYANGTQAVFGEGVPSAEVVFVREQPGDREDLTGRLFVGPAGGALDAALAMFAIDRSSVYVTNVAKHFEFGLRGKKRLHLRPNAGEVRIYAFWLDPEIRYLSPRIIVALGAKAPPSPLPRNFGIELRGTSILLYRMLFVTNHASYPRGLSQQRGPPPRAGII